MKRLLIITSILIISYQYSCKQIAKDVVDCSVEAISAFLSYENDTVTQNKVNFTFNFDTSSGQTINNVNWDFGDGKSQSTSSSLVSHIYDSKGNFSVEAKYTINMDGGTCSSSVSKSVKVE